MGAREVLGRDEKGLARYCLALVSDITEQARVLEADERVRLYRDDNLQTTATEINAIFANPHVRQRALKFARYGAAESLVRRISDEIGRMVYAQPPTRTVIDADDKRADAPGPADADATEHPAPDSEPSSTKSYAELCRELRLDAKLDLVARLLTATSQVGLMLRARRDGSGLVLDVLTPNQYHVIPDPDDPTKELAVIVRSTVRGADGRDRDSFTYVDESIIFTIMAGENGGGPIVGQVKPHGMGVLPFVGVRSREFWGGYWDRTKGLDLVNAQKLVSVLLALAVKLHKSQGEKIPIITGQSVEQSAKNQVPDGESPLVFAGVGVNVAMLDSVTPASHYWDSIDKTRSHIAQAYGISVERLNSTGAAAAIEVEAPLFERRNEMIRIFAAVEQALFALLRRFAAIPDDARLRVDFADASYRGDREKQLRVAKLELELGLINPLDLIREKNPEITDNDEALEELIVNERMKARVMEFRVARNVSQGNTGKTPEENGRLGPIARDAGQAGDGEDSPPPVEEQ